MRIWEKIKANPFISITGTILLFHVLGWISQGTWRPGEFKLLLRILVLSIILQLIYNNRTKIKKFSLFALILKGIRNGILSGILLILLFALTEKPCYYECGWRFLGEVLLVIIIVPLVIFSSALFYYFRGIKLDGLAIGIIWGVTSWIALLYLGYTQNSFFFRCSGAYETYRCDATIIYKILLLPLYITKKMLNTSFIEVFDRSLIFEIPISMATGGIFLYIIIDKFMKSKKVEI